MALGRSLFSGHVDQIGILVDDLDIAMNAYIKNLALSFRVFQVDQTMASFSGSSARFCTRFAVAQSGFSSVELIQPVSGSTIHSEHLKARGPGLHHLGFYVSSLVKAKRNLAAEGYRLLMEGEIQRLGQFSYFEAPDMHCVIEVLQLSIGLPLFLARHAVRYTGPG